MLSTGVGDRFLQTNKTTDGDEAVPAPDSLTTLSVVGGETPSKVVRAEYAGSTLTIAQHGDDYIELRAEVGGKMLPPPLLSDSAIADVLSEYLAQPGSETIEASSSSVHIFTSVDTNWPRMPRSKE